MCNSSAVFRGKLSNLDGDVRYAVVILHSNCHVLPKKSSCPKSPAFKTRSWTPWSSSCVKAEQTRDMQQQSLLTFTLAISFKNCQIQSTNVDFCPPTFDPLSIIDKICHFQFETCLADPVSATVPPRAPTTLPRSPAGIARYFSIQPYSNCLRCLLCCLASKQFSRAS